MANNIITAKVQVTGTKAFLFHRFSEDALPLEKKERSGVAGNDPNEWRNTFWCTKNGQLYVPASYIFSACINGAVHTKKGRSSIQASVSATLQVMDEKILFNRWFPGWPKDGIFDANIESMPLADPELSVYTDIRGVVNPSTRGRNIRYRIAMSPNWNSSFLLSWDKTIVSRNEMESVVRDTGTLVGIGSGRKIGMGRFEIVSFEVE